MEIFEEDLLKGYTLNSSIEKIIRKNCLTANVKISKRDIFKMMKKNGISQIPIVTENNELIGLEISEDLLPNSSEFYVPNFALLMAGGRGKRLMPITMIVQSLCFLLMVNLS